VRIDREGKMEAKRLFAAAIAMLLGIYACTCSLDTLTAPTVSPSPVPSATIERLDYYLEGNERPFSFQLLYSNEELACGFANPCALAATYREQEPYQGYPDGMAFIFGISGTSDTLSLVIPTDYAERIHLSPGNTYQIIVQTVPNWPDTFGLVIMQGDELVFQGISDWRLDASIPVGCLSPVRVEQVSMLTQRYREGGECLGRFTNTEIRFSLDGDARTLHQGQSATLGDLEINLDLARILDGSYCPDAGATNVSYTISQSCPGKPDTSVGTTDTATPGVVTPQPISIPDADLEVYLRRLAHKDTGALFVSDLEALRCFVRLYPVGWKWEGSANQDGISSLYGLEHATNLEAIYLSGVGIIDLSPLANLTQLTSLHIDHNGLSSLSPLEGLTSLTQLWASNNQISDLAPLSSLTSLSFLDLGDNGISDISPLSSLTDLDNLSLYDNEITDISPLSSLAHLDRLRLDLNQVKDISAVSALVSLDNLSIDYNQVEDIAPLSALVNLTELSLTQNSISDISALSPLVNLVVLYLGDNQISQIGTLENLAGLRLLDLQGNRVSDISPLLRNHGLGEGDWVDLRGNPLNADSVNRYLPELESRGVIVSR
jgi:internalin A